jgi:hypothetical protein
MLTISFTFVIKYSGPGPRISDTKHDFLKTSSTVTNLKEFSNSVIGEIENGRQVDGVDTDFSKAFDRVIGCYISICQEIWRDRCFDGQHPIWRAGFSGSLGITKLVIPKELNESSTIF